MKQAFVKILFFSWVCFFSLHYSFAQKLDTRATDQKFMMTMQLIRFAYVDTVDEPRIVERAIIGMLEEMDPHSTYISKKDVERSNEPLEGNFEGIGVEFQLFKDSILVVSAVPGGPSEKVGIIAGDRIVKINDTNSTGKNITNTYVLSKLRGAKGTKVNVGIARRGKKELLEFTITRDKIPINSIDATYMITPTIGYIKINRFAQTTLDEFRSSLTKLQAKGMKELVLDLRSNPGGYLNSAFELADEFLGSDKLIVYTEGIRSPVQKFKSSAEGGFEKGKLVVLIDEGSASASEIVAGAIQDWDRGLVIGRRSFGKGLVQRPFSLPDGSVIRLTTARYHTPTGRCIQRSYKDGADNYYHDLIDRFNHGELITADSVKFPDSLKYYTPNKRVVYGGGGIMPDIFVSIDTTKVTSYFFALRSKNLFNEFVTNYIEKNRDSLLKQYTSVETFKKSFQIDSSFMKEFTNYAAAQGVKRGDQVIKPFDLLNEYIIQNKDSLNKKYSSMMLVDENFMKNFNQYVVKKTDEIQKKEEENYSATEKYIKYILKGLIARNLFDVSAYYELTNELDNGYNKAVEVLQDDMYFKKNKIHY